MDCIRLLGKGLDTGWIPFCCSLGASSIGTMSGFVFISLCNTCTVSSRGRGGSYFRFFPQNFLFECEHSGSFFSSFIFYHAVRLLMSCKGWGSYNTGAGYGLATEKEY